MYVRQTFVHTVTVINVAINSALIIITNTQLSARYSEDPEFVT